MSRKSLIPQSSTNIWWTSSENIMPKANTAYPFTTSWLLTSAMQRTSLYGGDFWVFNYSQVGDTLKCVSGGSHPGLMHVTQTVNGLEVTGFDQVEDGSRYMLTAKEIFGDKYDAFQSINSDEKKREKLRAEGLARYVKEQGLSATMYQDYGWPVKNLE